MARYADCDKCYHRFVCEGDTDKWNYYGECPHYFATADAVPSSEVERYMVKPDGTLEMIPTVESVRQEVAREIFTEIEDIIARNTAHGFKGKYKVFCITGFNGGQITRLIAELKKKYIGE